MLKSTIGDAELCAALFEFDLSKLQTDHTSLQFIDLQPDQSLWLELAISPHKLLETNEAELADLDFEEMFLVRGGIKDFGWF